MTSTNKQSFTYGNPEDTSFWIKLNPIFRFNPVVTFASFLLIWAFVVVCLLVDIKEDLDEAKLWVAETFTWLYIGSQDVWAIFMVYMYFRYGHVKMGQDDDEPEYSTASWFMMLFACGLGVGLFFFGVAEPIFHYTGANRYTADPYISDNTLAQIAMNVTYYHWGIHAWIVYAIVGAMLGVISYRENLPMTMKSCFYPLIGDRIFTWIGDVIDIISVITTLFGVCTSLGLGVIQLNAGLNILNPDIPVGKTTQVIVIWCITCIATASTASGVGLGIRRISEICFGLGVALMTMVLFLDDTWYIFNVFTQSIGYYFQWILQIGFHCDAFEMHSSSHGATDRGRAAGDGMADGPRAWMDGWTIFYWGWWISWSPFVGIFIAKISKGRTVREFINGTLTAPSLYTFFWFAIFGGAGLGSERFAARAGYCCADWVSATFEDYNSFPTTALSVASMQTSWCEDANCGDCHMAIVQKYTDKGFTERQFAKNLYKTLTKGEGGVLGDWEQIQNFQGPSPSDPNRDTVRLSCLSSEQQFFYLMDSYYDVGRVLFIISVAGLILYFVTSSDSGSLVIDTLSSNGDPDPPIFQRIVWAVTEGAAATALIMAGDDSDALSTIQTASIITGLPFTIVICFVCVSFLKCCQVVTGELDPNAPTWKVGYFDFCTTLNFSRIKGWVVNIVLASYHTSIAAASVSGQKRFWAYIYMGVMDTFVVLFVALMVLNIWFAGCWAIAWVCLLMYFTIMSGQRVLVRNHLGYGGNPVEDFFACLFNYPSVGHQIQQEIDDGSLKFTDVEVLNNQRE